MHLLETSPLFVESTTGNLYIFEFSLRGPIRYLCQYDFVCILCSHVSMLWCVFVCYLDACVYVCIHMEDYHIFLYIQNENAASVVILEDRENMDPLFDSVTTVNTGYRKKWFFLFHVPFIYPEELFLFYSWIQISRVVVGSLSFHWTSLYFRKCFRILHQHPFKCPIQPYVRVFSISLPVSYYTTSTPILHCVVSCIKLLQ